MRLGVVGLGRMGGNIARRLLRAGHECVVWDRTAAVAQALIAEGAVAAPTFADMVAALPAPRAIWVMLPSGDVTETAIADLAGRLEPGDTLIDGGNSFYRDDIRRAATVAARGLNYVDVGTSGGVWGIDRGYCLMIGGEKSVVDALDPILATLAPGIGQIDRTKRPAGADPRPERGYIHAGPVGAGHFVKMVHNGIEYGLMQAYAEGFDILKGKGGPPLPEADRYDLNLPDIAEVWRRGSVVASWLLDLSAQALARDEDLAAFSGEVADSGEGRWTVDAAIEEAVPATVLTASLFARFRSRRDHTFADRMLSAMRLGFGGHVEAPAKGP
jgi:6-phosphogluconate dehydrogenase